MTGFLKSRRPRFGQDGHALFGLFLLLSPLSLSAAEYEPDRDLSTQAIFEIVRIGPDGSVPDGRAVDLDYVEGMRQHHAGALSMSEEYLADPEARNPILRRLARAIIPNQAFEIALLDEVKRQLQRPPKPLGLGGLALQPSATGDLEQRMRFLRAPRPFGWSAIFGDPGPITERDVLFAKAMIIHHAGALDMAQAYNDDPVGQNTFLEMLNLDIVTDQAQEIALMQAVVDRYPGDAEAIVVDPSMVHGMSGHRQAGHGASAGKEERKEAPATESGASRDGAPSAASPSGGTSSHTADGHAPKADHSSHTRH